MNHSPRIRSLGLTALAATLLLPLQSCGARNNIEQSANDRVIEMEHGGLQREFILHTPAGGNRGGLPLLFVLHGGGGTAKGMVRITEGAFNDIADREGLYVVYPQGYEKGWNDQRTVPISTAHEKNIDDVGFIRSIIEYMSRNYDIDRKRIFSTGLSNGGVMSFRLAMDMPDLIAGIAPVSSGMPVEALDAVKVIRDTSLLLMIGTEDPQMPIEGGTVKVLGRDRGRIVAAEETVRLWAKQLGCRREARQEALPDRADDDTRVFREVFRNCRGRNRVALYTIRGGGHTWAGGEQYLGKFLIGRTSRDFSASQTIWEFFKSL